MKPFITEDTAKRIQSIIDSMVFLHNHPAAFIKESEYTIFDNKDGKYTKLSVSSNIGKINNLGTIQPIYSIFPNAELLWTDIIYNP